MKVVHTIRQLQEDLLPFRNAGKKIGFVPTMGALHQGHLSLVERCAKENEVSVASIFVNPTQFNDANDLLRYPRTPEADILLLESARCDLVFAPSVEEMYPEPDTRQFDFGVLGQVMEGAHRPGHFNGVAQIVSKLFAAVAPDRAYFGEKDFQQLAIVRAMTRQLNLPVEIVACPIVREKSGLAMSSRNARLSREGLETASLLSQALQESQALKARKTVDEVKQYIVDRLRSNPRLQVEYVEIVDADTLQGIVRWTDSDRVIACLAVFCEGVRLIDNIIYDR